MLYYIFINRIHFDALTIDLLSVLTPNLDIIYDVFDQLHLWTINRLIGKQLLYSIVTL